MNRTEQPYRGDDRTLIEQWLDFQRATLAMKCDGLTPAQLAERACPPSTLSLARIVRHMADMEIFDTQMLLGRPIAGRYDSGQEESDGPEDHEQSDENDPDRGLYDWSVYDVDDDAVAFWIQDCAETRAAVASFKSLDERLPGNYSALTVRSLLLALIAEYSRHNGHADLLREAIDGSRAY